MNKCEMWILSHLHLHTLDERNTTWIRKKVWTHIDNCNCRVQTGCWPLTWDPPYTGQCHKRNFSCQIFIVRHIFPFWCDPIFHEVYPSPICPTPPTLLSHKPESFFRKSPHFTFTWSRQFCICTYHLETRDEPEKESCVISLCHVVIVNTL